MKVYELLSNESRWTRRAYARDAQGNMCKANDPDAQSWCIIGGVYKCYTGISLLDAEHRLLSTLPAQNTYQVAEWQDDPRVMFEMVRELLIAADV